MTDTEPRSYLRALASLFGTWWKRLRPPVGTARFWIVQFGVLSIAMGDEVFLDEMRLQLPFGVPNSATTSLLLIPVIYAALNFGRRGTVATALWATALVMPHWVLIHHLSPSHFWIETGYLAVINSVAIVVGQRVEHEQRARHRAEGALQAARIAEARYRGLFEEQPAPVIITDCAGVVAEVNTSAMRLFGQTAAGRPLRELLTVDVANILTQDPASLTLHGPCGEERLYAPTAHELATGDDGRLVQIVLTDITEQHRRREEHQAFASRLMAVQEDERRRLAQELHDDPLQNLTYLTRVMDDLGDDPELPARMAEQVQRNGAVATEVAAALRKVIRGLRPPILDDFGVVSALRQLTEEARSRSGLSIDLRVNGKQTRLSPELELTAYRIIQESLSNAIRHADARRVGIRVGFGEQIVLTVTDDGRGIQPMTTCRGEPGSGFGLIGIRERVNLAGGTLEMRARNPHGTVVQVKLPFSAPPDDAYTALSLDSMPAAGAR